MRTCDVAESFWRAVPCKLGYSRFRQGGVRDQVFVEGRAVTYLLWGQPIAVWHMDAETLEVDDSGWQTWLTKDRLNNVLSRLGLRVFSLRRRWYVHSDVAGRTYRWLGSHTIDIIKGLVQPAVEKKSNERASEWMRGFHERFGARRIFCFNTLTDRVYAVVLSHHGFDASIAVIVLKSGEMRAWRKRMATMALYFSAARGDAKRIVEELTPHGYASFEELREDLYGRAGLSSEELPDDLARQLALEALVA